MDGWWGSMSGALPAVDVQGLAGDEGGAFELQDSVDLAHVAELVESSHALGVRMSGSSAAGIHREVPTTAGVATTAKPGRKPSADSPPGAVMIALRVGSKLMAALTVMTWPPLPSVALS
jgi:hypothetical protein